MDSSIVIGIAENFVLGLLALPVLLLGMWLTTKNKAFYSIVLMGIAWMAFVISGVVYDLCVMPGIATSVKILAWFVPFIFFVGLNTGSILTIQSMKRGEQCPTNSTVC